MSLPQTVCGSPAPEQARVIVCPSALFSEVAFSSQDVGLPAPPEDGGTDAGPETGAEAFLWPRLEAALLSFLSLAQPAALRVSTVASSKSQKLMFERSNFLLMYESITGNFLSIVCWYVRLDAA
jgi:hypothetical protein